ncbi:hypothetical protein LJ739_17875 [Aestuariibacter halophilus]|uniref:Calx-beta domain-containing protein n=1 Tax=Fluctibacter halophilus TaxID=226011 RepID=A0ABS8GEA9_9ALTE|nr:Calx-beta domain-containing protein [Aestuariibacter halophilus]MCC2618129.1 hypothetical protein [Aestuariibacter halophilus]
MTKTAFFIALFCILPFQSNMASTRVSKDTGPLQAEDLYKRYAQIKGVKRKITPRTDDNQLRYVDILVLYTAELASSTSRETLQSYLEIQTGFANLALENHGIPLRRRIVAVEPLLFEDNGDPSLQGFYQRVLSDTQRYDQMERFSADSLLVLRARQGGSYCGWASIQGTVAVMEYGAGCFVSSLAAHEWGHNDGMEHDRDKANYPLTNYSYAWQCAGHGTIMNESVDRTTRHPLYSSPDIVIEGDPCGIAEQADNARLLREHMALAQEHARLDYAHWREMPIYGEVAITSHIDSVEQAEEGLDLYLTIERSGDISQATSVEFYTRSMTATAGEDFLPLTTRVTFDAGVQQQSVTVHIVDDAEGEDTETFEVGIRYPENLTITSVPIQVSLTSAEINLGQVSFEQASISVAETVSTISIPVIRLNSQQGELVVDYFTENGNATAGTDYASVSGQLVFSEGDDIQTITVPIMNNNRIDGDRRFTVNLRGDQIGEFGQITVNIRDDDKASSSGGGSMLLLNLWLLLMIWRRRYLTA